MVTAGRTVLFSTHQMETAEKVVDAVCIIARGKRVVEGRLADIKRESAPEGLVALDFIDEASHGAAAPVLADRALVAENRAGEVKLAPGVAPQQLLAALVSANAGVRRFELVVPSLHQIFVDKVGADAAVAQRNPDA